MLDTENMLHNVISRLLTMISITLARLQFFDPLSIAKSLLHMVLSLSDPSRVVRDFDLKLDGEYLYVRE